MFRVFCIVFMLSTLGACSLFHKNNHSSKSPEKKEKEELPQPVVVYPLSYTPEEIKRFELLDHYRKLREDSLSKTENKKKGNSKKKIIPVNTIASQITSPSDLAIQLDQQMTYFCIKFESRFAKTTDCKAHTENVLRSCQEKKVADPSLNLIQCLKKHM